MQVLSHCKKIAQSRCSLIGDVQLRASFVLQMRYPGRDKLDPGRFSAALSLVMAQLHQRQ